MSTFQDKSSIVTGAGSGIGYGLCQAFAEAGAYVALNDLNGPLAEEAAAKINASIGAERVYPYVLDIANIEAVREMVDDWAEKQGRLDVVVANAGISHYGLFIDYTVEAFDRITSVNLVR